MAKRYGLRNAFLRLIMHSEIAPILFLLGPTASGKTAAALRLADCFPVEVISMDSALVYRDMDIGTAKPTQVQRQQVVHHLIDILDPAIPYSAAKFVQDVQGLITEIRARGNLPLIVGGTMLYFKALTQGLSELPAANAQIRQQLEQEAASSGWPALHQRLAACDEVTASRLAPNDSQRIQRALEIFMVSGTPMSLLLQDKRFILSEPWYAFSLEPNDRAVLHQRIALRFDEMLEHGFIEEVEKLRARKDLNLDTPAIRCVGYRQAWQYLDGEFDRAALREQGIAATRQLAKRQLTWLRSFPERHRMACDTSDYLVPLLQAVKEYWG